MSSVDGVDPVQDTQSKQPTVERVPSYAAALMALPAFDDPIDLCSMPADMYNFEEPCMPVDDLPLDDFHFSYLDSQPSSLFDDDYAQDGLDLVGCCSVSNTNVF